MLNFLPTEIQGELARKQFEALLGRSFPVPVGGSFFDDFPIWDENMTPGMREICRFGIFTSDELDMPSLVSCVGIRIGNLKTKKGLIKAAIIGAVATDAGLQGKGLATSLVAHALDWAQKRGAGLAFLFGSQTSMYRKLGFEPCGQQARAPLRNLSNISRRDCLIKLGWTPAIFGALQNRRGGLAYEPSDLTWISAHKNIAWFWIGTESRVEAYAAVGRGMDMRGVAHEWGGEKLKLLALLRHIGIIYPGSALLGSPDMIDQLGIQLEGVFTEPLCLVKFFGNRLEENSFWIWGLDGA